MKKAGTAGRILLGVVIFLTWISGVSAQTWVLTGNMAESRARHSAVLLCDGRVLVLGSAGHAELYDPVTRTFTPTGDMHTTGYEATATRLLDCKVLVAGGNARTGTGADPGLSGAEIYDPTTGIFTLTGSLSVPRKRHAAALLQNGRVLITGGNASDSEFYATAEIFDPNANGGVGAFSSAGTMSRARTSHTATRLLDGRVLVVGGSFCPCPVPPGPADIYDPVSGTWSVTGSTQEGLAVHTATLLISGKVLIAGGGSGGGPLTLGTAELYDPATNAFTFTTPLNQARKFHAASLLPNGLVLISGGQNDSTRLSSAEIYDPVLLTWTLTPAMNLARETHTSTLLLNNEVLVTGGSDAGPTAEVFTFHMDDPPVCTQAQANPSSLWPPNHQFISVSIVGVTDPDNDHVTLTVTGITQDEPINGLGDGNTSPDAVIQSQGTVLLRAERSGQGNGRVYQVHFTADDGVGGHCDGSVKVCVSPDQGKGKTCIDDGQRFDSTKP